MTTLKIKATFKAIFNKMKATYVISFLLGVILIFISSYVKTIVVLSQILFTLGVTFLAFGSIQGFLEAFARKEFFVDFVNTLLWKEDIGTILDEEILKTFLRKSLNALLGNEKLGEGYYKYLQKNVLKYKETGFWSVLHLTCNLVLDRNKSRLKWNELYSVNKNEKKYNLDESLINVIHNGIIELYRVFEVSFSLSTKRTEWNWRNILDSIEKELMKLVNHSKNVKMSMKNEIENAARILDEIKRRIRKNKYYVFVVHIDTSAMFRRSILSYLDPAISSSYSINMEDLFLYIAEKLGRNLSEEEKIVIRKYVLDTYFKVTRISINGYKPNQVAGNTHWEIYLPTLGINIEIYEFELPEEVNNITLSISKVVPWYFEDLIYENFIPVPTETLIFEFSLDSDKELFGPYLSHHILSDNEPLIDVDPESHKVILRVDGWCLPPSLILVRWYV